MANPEHLEILKQGVGGWNRWRLDHPNITPDLDEAVLSGMNLRNADFRGAFLSEANLRGSFLEGVSFNFHDASPLDSSFGIIHYTSLDGADFSGTVLSHADLSNTLLERTNFSGANLTAANFTFADFKQTILTNSIMGATVFANTDLSSVLGLDRIRHLGPSTIGIDTIYKSGGQIPEAFLRGCGVPDTFITFARSLVGSAIDYYSAFISHSGKNADIAERLYADLQSKGVRCWFAPEDMKIGDKFRQRIDEAIRIHDKLLVILSEESISSAWVEEEVESALEREHREKRLVLFPVRIDDAVINSGQAWAAALRRMRHIGDFSQWKDHDSYSKAFARLLRDLKAGSEA